MRRILLVILGIFIVSTVGVYAIFAHDLKGKRASLVGRSTTMETFGTLEYAVMGDG